MPKDARQVTDFIPATSGPTEGAGPYPGPDEQSERPRPEPVQHELTKVDNPQPGTNERPERPRPEPTKHELTKISANFVPRAIQALDLAGALTGDTRTDVLNRAVQAYAYLVKMMNEGNLLFVENPTTNAKERIVFL
jgi:hypothetical protein